MRGEGAAFNPHNLNNTQKQQYLDTRKIGAEQKSKKYSRKTKEESKELASKEKR